MAKARLGGAERREQILAVALDLFVEHGIHAVSTRQIARSVGISQPSLYAHFPSRDAIATEVSRRAFERLRDRMTAALAHQGSVADRMVHAGREYVRFGLDEPAAYRVAFMLDRPEGARPSGTSPVSVAGLPAFSVLLRFMQEVRGSADQATDIAAQSAWAALHGLVSLLLARPEFPWADRASLIDYHLNQTCRAALS